MTAAAPLHFSQSKQCNTGSQSGASTLLFSTNVGSTELNRFEAEVELPLCDFKDVTLVVLEGKCSLSERSHDLETRNAVFIPAHSSYAAQADLIFYC